MTEVFGGEECCGHEASLFAKRLLRDMPGASANSPAVPASAWPDCGPRALPTAPRPTSGLVNGSSRMPRPEARRSRGGIVVGNEIALTRDVEAILLEDLEATGGYRGAEEVPGEVQAGRPDAPSRYAS